jgi:violaxanthin de-epoxidase
VGKPDEGECQVKCGDEFTNAVVGDFTKCAVSDSGCVPQRPDDNSYPVPKESALVEKFSPKDLIGDWYISAGLNPSFDTFDCQLHKFEAPADNKLKGNLQWRIKDPVAGTQFVTRTTVQEFVQDEKVPGILYNHDNEFLHYQDDWYILAQKPREYVLVYYRGSNDAWDGYGGAVVYTTKPTLDKKYYGELDGALNKVGLKFADFQLTDNTCKKRESKLEELEADLVFVESKAATGLQVAGGSAIKAAEQEALLVEKVIEKDVVLAEKVIEKDALLVEKAVEKEAVLVKDGAVRLEKAVEKEAGMIEKELEKDIIEEENAISKFFKR